MSPAQEKRKYRETAPRAGGSKTCLPFFSQPGSGPSDARPSRLRTSLPALETGDDSGKTSIISLIRAGLPEVTWPAPRSVSCNPKFTPFISRDPQVSQPAN
ncbi:hypothetical protein CCM_04509 [Cordyceps militaris CM01]|uniref:Uncharacterized protein n=1 Tax=Cordyceps militaris (strain CM01) TaxID=983644 RepID=G3JFE7_CORMM|nr:uncharacterized protein CCM_04509 [Cordyceps militaris CM01]EGX93137.1 hypothetical protein CCM_04509 [Cordyceps militaris CM01]